MLKSAFTWRLYIIKQHYLKFVWTLRNLTDFRKKIDVTSLSIIVVGRNDNYGGDFTNRLKATLDWNLAKLPEAELIYIEWNKIEDKPSDCEWISKRYPNSNCYIVPATIHKSISSNPKMPMMEYFAKNLGIRKSNNEWILMINADVFLGLDTLRNIKRLNRKSVYGTHYVSIAWDGEPLQEYHLTDKSKVVTAFSAPSNLSATAGNFILTHKNNWLSATGYDESLTNVRAGVDSNGLQQLLYLGLKPKVIGHHFHLDHPESIIHGKNDTHGTHSFNNIPYKNPHTWGLMNYSFKQISNRIWQLQTT